MTIIRKGNNGTFKSAQHEQTRGYNSAGMGPCSTICQPYSVPGGGTPCGSICIMYCVGKQ